MMSSNELVHYRHQLTWSVGPGIYSIWKKGGRTEFWNELVEFIVNIGSMDFVEMFKIIIFKYVYTAV